MPRGQKPKQMSGKVVYLDQCPLIREIYAPGDPEMYAERAAKAIWDAIEELEAKGLMGESAKKTAS